MRWLVISDTHIGDDRSDRNLASLLKLVESHASQDSHLVLNGDIFDLASCLSMDSRHKEFINAARQHGKVTYLEGNHDWIIRGLGEVLSKDIEFADELRFEAGGRKFRILHGHQFDLVANRLPRANRFIIRLNHFLRRLTDIDFQFILRATDMGRWMLGRQEKRMIKKEKWADIVVAGHTHRPRIAHFRRRTYINTGDWIERPNRAYLTIREDGDFDLRLLGG
jgi:UDP-2,3-diacylglucosamine pyrophosphatase LpxH